MLGLIIGSSKPRPSDRYTPKQCIATLLGAVFWACLATLLRHVGWVLFAQILKSNLEVFRNVVTGVVSVWYIFSIETAKTKEKTERQNLKNQIRSGA